MVVGVVGLIVSLIWVGTSSRRTGTTMIVDQPPAD